MRAVAAFCAAALLGGAAAWAQGAPTPPLAQAAPGSAPGQDASEQAVIVRATMARIEDALVQIDTLVGTLDAQLVEMQTRMDDASGAERDRLQGLIDKLTEKLDAIEAVRADLAAQRDAARATLGALEEAENG